jgi:hypothetical protein
LGSPNKLEIFEFEEKIQFVFACQDLEKKIGRQGAGTTKIYIYFFFWKNNTFFWGHAPVKKGGISIFEGIFRF